MKQTSLALALVLTLVPFAATAQDAAPDPAESAEEGPSLIDRGLALLFEGLSQEMEPALDEMANALQEFGPAVAPALERLMALVDDMTNYEMPQMMENGDILIRRKPDAPAVVPQPDDALEL